MDTNTKSDPKIANYLGQIKTEIEQLLILLSSKEKFVIERRFNLDNKKKATLEEVGKHFNVTRERIRQIEKNALQKLRRNIEKFDFFAINDFAYEVLKTSGGVLREDLLISKLLKESTTYSAATLLLILSLDKRFEHVGNTIHYGPYFRFIEITDEIVDQICNFSKTFLTKKKDIVKVDNLASELKLGLPKANIYSSSILFSLFQINKEFKVIEDQVGLQEWRHIHPRTLRDKIYYVLRQQNKPIHFVDISNAIVNLNFDKKPLNLQAVHNELIRHNDFVLIGRGIYALKEWGYEHGTVAEIIGMILKGKDSLSEEQVISEVLKRRQVKPITIILNLKNKPEFTRVGRKQYALK